MLTIEMAKKLIDAEQRCNFEDSDIACPGCPYYKYYNDKGVYPCIDKKAEDIINFLKEWIYNESHRLDNV